MNNCEDKTTLSCPPNSPFASCIKTEVVPPVFSSLTNTCNTVQQVETDIYLILTSIKTELDLSTATSSCQTLPTIKNVKTLIQFLLNRDCAQQTQIDTLIAQNTTQANQITALQSNLCD